MEAEKILDDRLWSLWLHDYRREGGKQPYGEWKKAALGKADPKPKSEVKAGTEESMARSLEVANTTLRKLRQATERR